jgi:hypothetical protein
MKIKYFYFAFKGTVRPEWICMRVVSLESRVSTEFRRHGIPSVFYTSVYSVFRAELAAIPAEFRRIPCRIIP